MRSTCGVTWRSIGRAQRRRHDHLNLFRRLQHEWCALAAGPSAVDALRSWAYREPSPSLGMFDDPAQLPRHCPMRTDPARPRRLLAAVLRVADGDRLAQRTLLQLADRLQAQARHTG